MNFSAMACFEPQGTLVMSKMIQKGDYMRDEVQNGSGGGPSGGCAKSQVRSGGREGDRRFLAAALAAGQATLLVGPMVDEIGLRRGCGSRGSDGRPEDSSVMGAPVVFRIVWLEDLLVVEFGGMLEGLEGSTPLEKEENILDEVVRACM